MDGSPNSLDESVFRTIRERVLNIKSMAKEMVWQIGQLQDLFKYVKDAGLDDTVYAVLGGIPAEYDALWAAAKDKLQDGINPRQVIGRHLCAKISQAITTVRNSKAHSDMKEIIKMFDKEKSWIKIDTDRYFD